MQPLRNAISKTSIGSENGMADGALRGVSHNRLAAVALACFLVLGVVQPSAGAQADPRVVGDTGYRIDDDSFWDYFNGRGQARTFGFPASAAFTFLGCKTQFFQRLVMQRCGNGGVATLNLLDEGLLPYTTFNGSVVPGPDAALKSATPRPEDPAYASAVLEFVRFNAPDTFDGEPVNFQQTFLNTISPSQAGTSDPNLLGLLDLELWGTPTSRPAHDPSNPDFIYLRFQRGIMHYQKGCQCTQGMLLADYLKSVIIGQGLPSDLADQAHSSPLLLSAVNGRPPDGTDYGGAFRDVVPATVPTPVPAPSAPPVPTALPAPSAAPTVAPQPESLLGRKKEDVPGQVQAALAYGEAPIGSERCTSPLPASGTLQLDLRPGLDMIYPDIFTMCVSDVASDKTDVRISSSQGGSSLKPDFSAGTRWPLNGPPPVGTYSISGRQAAGNPPQDKVADPVSVNVVEASRQRVLIYPRRGAPGTTFDVYLGGFARNKPATLRLYRCDTQHGGGRACNDNDPRVYVTSLPPVDVDGSGHGRTQIKSDSSDPKTEFAVLSDDMARSLAQNHLIRDDSDGVGKAWFCTAPAPTCLTEREQPL
jgi:hypothetical protein